MTVQILFTHQKLRLIFFFLTRHFKRHLHIRNYALIEQLSIGFGAGFSVITGETGAGKSILLGALGLVLGDRADTGVLYDPTQKCVVEAQFLLPDDRLRPLFEEHDLDFQTE